jgi:membrane fusion protein (multidrug efflux system)
MLTKFFTWFITLAFLAAGTYYFGFYLQSAQSAAEAPKGPPKDFALPVEVAPVHIGTVTRAVEAVGTLRADESVVIRPEVGGRVKEFHFDEGQAVSEGTTLVTLEASIFEAEVNQAQARLDLSQTNSQRVSSMRKRGLGTEQEEDQAQSELRVSKAVVALAEARLDKMIIKAPFSGVLGLRSVSAGEYVSPGQDLVQLLAIDPIKVDFRVPELFVADVKPGQAIELQVDAFPGETFIGEVYAIDPQVDINGRSLVLRATVPNKERRLYAGLFARVNLILERRDNARLIPEEALVPQGGKQFVFKVIEDKAVRSEVSIGQRHGAEVEIISGVEENDIVITGGQLKVREGASVKPLPPQPQPSSQQS